MLRVKEKSDTGTGGLTIFTVKAQISLKYMERNHSYRSKTIYNDLTYTW